MAETGILTTHGEDLFPYIFKLTDYEDQEFSVTNDPIEMDASLPVPLHQMDILERKLPSLQMQMQKINMITNNILIRYIDAMRASFVNEDHKRKLFMSICELMYSQDKVVSTRQIARMMFYMAALVQLVEIEKQSGYFMGALFAMGGILKIEARSYLETKKKYDEKFKGNWEY